MTNKKTIDYLATQIFGCIHTHGVNDKHTKINKKGCWYLSDTGKRFYWRHELEKMLELQKVV